MAQDSPDSPNERIRELKDGDTLGEHEQELDQEEWDYVQKRSQETGETLEKIVLDAWDELKREFSGGLGPAIWQIIREEAERIRREAGNTPR